ncbi:MAG: hypothetical protein RJQ14_06155, partial [Marinoscillum sp.]
MKNILAIIFLLYIQTLVAQTPLSGTIDKDSILTLSNSPYLVTNNLTIDVNATLTIEAGTVIKIQES